MARRWCILLVMVTAVFLINGCGSPDNGRAKSYGHDGYMGISNSNPNLPGRHSAWNYGNDSDFVVQTLKPVKGIKNINININGPAMRVKLKTDKNLSRQERDAIITKSQSLLDANFGPRYNVKVLPGN